MSGSDKLVPREDGLFLMSIDAEVFDLFYYPLTFTEIDRATTVKDPLFNESDDKRFKSPVDMDVYVDRAQRKKTLTKYGFDSPRDVLLIFSNAKLADYRQRGLLSDDFPQEGDRFTLDSSLYEVQLVRSSERWPNLNLRFHTAAQAQRVRDERVAADGSSEGAVADVDLYTKI